MASAIDASKPVTNSLINSADLRANFSAAKSEIEALQAAVVGVTDGDKGDIFVSGSGTVWSVDLNGATSKTTPIDADLIGIADSASSYSLAKLTFANLKTYLNTLYEQSTNKDATGGYAGLTLFKINFKNAANTFTSFFTNSNTASRTYTFPDKDGTVALAEDVHDATSKTTPIDADEIGLIDSAASNVLKKLTWVNLKATLKTYFDTLYSPTAQILHVRDEKTTGSYGGTSSNTTVHVRTLNTVATNTITGASLASNQITLPAGTYKVYFRTPCFGAGNNRARLYNVTDTASALLGSSCSTASNTQSDSVGEGIITLAGTKVLELRHYVTTGVATFGLGVSAADGLTEVYAEVFITKIS